MITTNSFKIGSKEEYLKTLNAYLDCNFKDAPTQIEGGNIALHFQEKILYCYHQIIAQVIKNVLLITVEEGDVHFSAITYCDALNKIAEERGIRTIYVNTLVGKNSVIGYFVTTITNLLHFAATETSIHAKRNIYKDITKLIKDFYLYHELFELPVTTNLDKAITDSLNGYPSLKERFLKDCFEGYFDFGGYCVEALQTWKGT